MPVEAAVAAGTMEITVSKFELLRELTATQGVVERKTTIPILSNYLFEAAGDRLSITATDLDLSLRTSCAAGTDRRGFRWRWPSPGSWPPCRMWHCNW